MAEVSGTVDGNAEEICSLDPVIPNNFTVELNERLVLEEISQPFPRMLESNDV